MIENTMHKIKEAEATFNFYNLLGMKNDMKAEKQ